MTQHSTTRDIWRGRTLNKSLRDVKELSGAEDYPSQLMSFCEGTRGNVLEIFQNSDDPTHLSCYPGMWLSELIRSESLFFGWFFLGLGSGAAPMFPLEDGVSG
jgi:hypothetical protein